MGWVCAHAEGGRAGREGAPVSLLAVRAGAPLAMARAWTGG
jgi:hypothetical protein